MLRIFQVTLTKEFDVFVEAESVEEVEAVLRKTPQRTFNDWDESGGWDARAYPCQVKRSVLAGRLMGAEEGRLISDPAEWQERAAAHSAPGPVKCPCCDDGQHDGEGGCTCVEGCPNS